MARVIRQAASLVRGFVSEEDFEYVMGYCSDALRFFEEALADSRPVMFEGAG